MGGLLLDSRKSKGFLARLPFGPTALDGNLVKSILIIRMTGMTKTCFLQCNDGLVTNTLMYIS